MLKNSTISISLFLALACGQTPVVVQNDVQDLPVSDLNYIDIGSPQEEPPTDNTSFARIENPVDATEQEQPAEEQPAEEEPAEEQPAEEEPAEEQPAEEQPAEEQPAEEQPVEEEPAEEQPVEEEPAEEQPVEEEPAEEEVVEEEPAEEQPAEEEVVEEEPAEEEVVEESGFTGECELDGNIYNFNSICLYPSACLSRHVDNFETIPETGFCGKICFGHSNCPGDTQCVLNGVTPGVGYCEQ